MSFFFVLPSPAQIGLSNNTVTHTEVIQRLSGPSRLVNDILLHIYETLTSSRQSTAPESDAEDHGRTIFVMFTVTFVPRSARLSFNAWITYLPLWAKAPGSFWA